MAGGDRPSESSHGAAQAIIGAWRLISFEIERDDGTVIRPFGVDAQGSIIYTDSGRFSVQVMRKGRPSFAAGDQMRGIPEEIEASYKGCISYYGSYKLDADGGFVVHQVEGSLFPNWEGEDEVAIKVIVELQAKPGRRAELMSLLENIVAKQGPSQRGFLGSTRYEVLDNPDMLVEIADWESAEGAGGAHAGGCGHWRLHTSVGDVGRAIQGYGHQADHRSVVIGRHCSRYNFPPA